MSLNGGPVGKRSVTAPARDLPRCFDSRRDTAYDKSLEFDLLARIVDIYADQISCFIVVQNDTVGDLAAFDARVLRQVDVERIRLRVIVDLHGLNRLSKNALWIVILSPSVITRKY